MGEFAEAEAGPLAALFVLPSKYSSYLCFLEHSLGKK